MARKQNETNATELWLYFQSVINWVKTLFTNYRSEQKGIEWEYYIINISKILMIDLFEERIKRD